FHGTGGGYWRPYLAILGMGVLGFALLVAGLVAVAAIADDAQGMAQAIATWVTVPIYLGFLALLVYGRVRYTNLLWNNASLGPHRFESSLRVRDMLWLYTSNGI